MCNNNLVYFKNWVTTYDNMLSHVYAQSFSFRNLLLCELYRNEIFNRNQQFFQQIDRAMRMLSIHSYFVINDRNVTNGRLLKCGIFVSHCVGRFKICKIFRLR